MLPALDVADRSRGHVGELGQLPTRQIRSLPALSDPGTNYSQIDDFVHAVCVPHWPESVKQNFSVRSVDSGKTLPYGRLSHGGEMTNFGVRPAEITAELVASWEAKRQADPECCFLDTPTMRELYYAGEYVDVLLGRLGASKQDMVDLSFEVGQRAWPWGKNVWGIVAELVERYKAGREPEPGLETAKEVFQKWMTTESDRWQ